MSTKSPAVSIILTVYQVEDFLPRCLESIINQSFQDIEIIVIDDGSKDRSGTICDIYAKRDSRIRVFHKLNEGPSASRQFGIECAKGEFIIFCDSDDWVELNMLEELYRVAKVHDSDIVWCDIVFEYEGRSVVSQQRPKRFDSKTIFSDLYYPINASVWNKLIKSSLYSEWGVYYDKDIKYAEDLFVMMQMYSNPINTAYVSLPLYHYDKHSNAQSLTHVDDANAMVNSIKIFDKVFDKKAKPLVKFKCSAMMRAYEQGLYSSKELSKLYPEAHWYFLLEGFMYHNLAMIKLGLSFFRLKWMGDVLEFVIKSAAKVKHNMQCQ